MTPAQAYETNGSKSARSDGSVSRAKALIRKPNLDRLRELLCYAPETGVFTRRVSTHGGRWKAGTVAGSLRPDGYFAIRVEGELFYAHRLAWFYVTGQWPQGEVDHIDGNRTNNRFDNLRVVTREQNCFNSAKPVTNKSGYKGVCLNPTLKRPWVAQISIEGVTRNVGYYSSPEEAHAAYVKAAKTLRGEFARVE